MEVSTSSLVTCLILPLNPSPWSIAIPDPSASGSLGYGNVKEKSSLTKPETWAVLQEGWCIIHTADNGAARTEIAQAIESKQRVFAQQLVDSQQAAGGNGVAQINYFIVKAREAVKEVLGRIC